MPVTAIHFMWWHYSETILILPFSVINKTWPQFCSLVCVHVCKKGRERGHEEENRVILSSRRLSRWTYSGESSGCKMRDSMVTEGDAPPLRKITKREEEVMGWEEEDNERESERKGRRADGHKGMEKTWQVLYHLLRHCWAARKQSLGFSGEQPSS